MPLCRLPDNVRWRSSLRRSKRQRSSHAPRPRRRLASCTCICGRWTSSTTSCARTSAAGRALETMPAGGAGHTTAMTSLVARAACTSRELARRQMLPQSWQPSELNTSSSQFSTTGSDRWRCEAQPAQPPCGRVAHTKTPALQACKDWVTRQHQFWRQEAAGDSCGIKT